MRVEVAAPVPRPIARWALVSTGSIPVLLTTAWLIADQLQPAEYSPMRQTVSVLSGHAGTHRWIVTSALYAIGACYLASAAGLGGALSIAARAGLLVAGLAGLGVAAFPEPAHGTSRGHALCTAIGAVAITVWPAIVARHRAVVAVVGVRASFAAIIASAALFVWTVIETRDGSVLGLAERVSSSLQVCWPFVVILAVHRAQRSASSSARLTRPFDLSRAHAIDPADRKATSSENRDSVTQARGTRTWC
jgi:hypothetical protein